MIYYFRFDTKHSAIDGYFVTKDGWYEYTVKDRGKIEVLSKIEVLKWSMIKRILDFVIM